MKPNQYEISDESSPRERTVQIKVLDVVYANRFCNLVYMRDITSLVNSMKKESQEIQLSD